MLTTGALHALLRRWKRPAHAIFILATTELHEIPATITSRCQRFDFRRVPIEAMVARLRFIAEQEGFSVPDEGLLAIAREARGALRDAITLLEQIASMYGSSPSTDDVLESLGLVRDERTEKLAGALAERDLGAALEIARDVAGDGIDMARFTRETIDTLRERCSAPPATARRGRPPDDRRALSPGATSPRPRQPRSLESPRGRRSWRTRRAPAAATTGRTGSRLAPAKRPPAQRRAAPRPQPMIHGGSFLRSSRALR